MTDSFLPFATLLAEAGRGRTFHGIQQDRKQTAAEAVDALLDLFARNHWPRPTVVLVGRAADVHPRADGIIVRVTGQHEPIVRPGEFYAEKQQ